MMKIDPVNPVIHQSLKNYLIKSEKFGQDTFYDYDNCQYTLAREEEEPEVLKMGFSCNCYKQIMENGGQEMLDELYKDSLLPEDRHLPNMDITLGIRVADSGKT